MTQQVINTGAVANDGTGESLRNAFDAVNNNFANIWTAGPVDSQVVISNNRISTTVQNLALVLAGNGVGTITVDSSVVPGIDSVYDLGTANSQFDSVYSRYFYGNGAFLTGISNGGGSATSVTFSATPPLAANIGDIWIQSDTGIQYLYFNDNTSNQWAEMEAYQSFSSGGTGNGNVDLTSVSSDIIPSTNNSYSLGSSGYQWKDLWVSNSTIYLNSLPITADGANLKVNGNTVLTTSSPLSFSNLSVTGNVSANAVYTNNYFYANGAPFPQGSNSLPGTTISLKDNVISTTTLNQNLVLSANGVGNVQTNSSIMPDATQVRDIGSVSNKFNSIYAGYYYGNGSQLTGISAGNSNSIISGNSNVKIISAGGNVTIGIGGIGNIVVVSGAGEYVTGVVSASGNITAPYFVGNGSLLTGITTVAAANTAQTVTANAQANITSVGTLTSLSVTGTVQSGNILTAGIVSTTGNITGNFFIGNGSQLTGLPATYGNANVVANLAALGSNPVSTTGNITSGYLFGNGSLLTGIAASYGNSNVVANLAALGSNPVSTTGNITGGNLTTAGIANVATLAVTGSATVQGSISIFDSSTSLSATGNVIGGNVKTVGLISATGNVTAGNVSTGVITLTNGAVIRDTAGDAVAFGQNAGGTSQGTSAVAIGSLAGNANQGVQAVALGTRAGQTTQGNNATAIGADAGYSGQSANATAVGGGSAQVSQGDAAVAVGHLAGQTSQGISAVAIGKLAGNTNQANNSIILNATGVALDQTTANTFTVAPVRNDVANIGQVVFYNTTSKEITYGNTISVAGNITGNYFIGNGSQLTNLPSTDWANIGNITNANGPQNIAIGENVHQTFTYTPGFGTVAIGYNAGQTNQGGLTVAVGWQAGQTNQSNNAIAIGYAAGATGQEDGAVAIGAFAGSQFQGADAIAIGKYAGYNGSGVAQPDNTIFLNATGTNMGGVPAQTNSFYVAPVRNDVANVAEIMFYNTTSKEITYGNVISVAGNITSNYFIGNGSQLTGIAASYGNANVVANLAALGSNPVSTTGNITSGNISTGTITTTGNITFAGDSSSAPTLNNFNVNAVSITATAGNLSVINGGAANLSGGYLSVARDISATGNITGNFFIGNGSQLTGITAASSYGNANVVANLAALGTNPVSTTGNISGNYFFGNGSQLSSVATQVTGSWTLAAGTNTVSLTVPGPGTYSIWVNGNIPNGIVTYTATIVVTNTNVPVVGSSYGWYYAAGNALVLTAIPNQIVGTENNISTAVVATTTANVFTFGITNNSGSSQVVNYGYTKL